MTKNNATSGFGAEDMDKAVQNNPITEESSGIDTPAALIADFRFIELLGEGTSGKTYLAAARADNSPVAVKVLKLDSTFKSMELFEREAKTLSAICVPGVPKFYGYVKSDHLGEAYIIQEYVKYPSLQDFIKEGKKFEEYEVIGIMNKLAGILEHLQMDYVPAIIHRDIKPSNILYDEKGGNVFLIDFGAVANPQRKTMGSTVAGTMGFMAPEQLMGDCTIQSDYYALGATALYLLTGVSPADMEHAKDDPFKLEFRRYLDYSVSDPMIDFLGRLLSKECSDRPKNISDLKKYIASVRKSSRKYVKSKHHMLDFDVSINSSENEPIDFINFILIIGSVFVLMVLALASCYGAHCLYVLYQESSSAVLSFFMGAGALLAFILSIAFYVFNIGMYIVRMGRELAEKGWMNKCILIIVHVMSCSPILEVMPSSDTFLIEVVAWRAVLVFIIITGIALFIRFIWQMIDISFSLNFDTDYNTNYNSYHNNAFLYDEIKDKKEDKKRTILHVEEKKARFGKTFYECFYRNRRSDCHRYIFEASDLYMSDHKMLLRSDDSVEIYDENNLIEKLSLNNAGLSAVNV